MEITDIKEDMKVVGSDGEHVGTVDGVEGDQIKLTKADSPNGQHNFIAASIVESCEGETVSLSQTAAEVMAGFGSESATAAGSTLSAVS